VKYLDKMSIKSAIQINTILSFLPQDRKEKIPENVWNKIKDKSDNFIDTNIKEPQDIKEKNILPETKKYLSFIFLNYLSTKEEREEYIKIIKNNEEIYQKLLSEKYNKDNIFKKAKTPVNIENKQINLPAKIEKNFFKIILNKIKSLFK